MHRASRPARKLSPYALFGILLAIALPPAALPLFACDTAALGANTTVQVVQRAGPALQRYRDPDLAEEGIPGTIGTLEGLLEVRPTDLALRQILARAYASYGFGFMAERMEQAEFDSAEENVIEHWRNRASLAFVRAREVAVQGLEVAYREGGSFEAQKARGLEAFTAYIAHFNHVGEEAPLLFWTAYSWANYVNLHRDDMDAVADLPFVMVVAERALAIDSTYLDHAPRALHAALLGSAPAELGGRPADAKAEFDQAIEASHRKNLTYLVTEARIAAIGLQDRALYRALLEEAIAFDVDSDPDMRLQNLIAQRRARRYLEEIDNFFEPEGSEPMASAE